MSQHDFIIDNQFFPQTRADINAALQAIATNSSGATEPAIPTTSPVTDRGHQWWYDTTNYQLKIRNTAGTGWTVIATLDAAGANVVSITTQGLTLGSTAILASADEINTLNDLTRGSLIYGNSSGATARLAKGAADTVLTSDGTDISWAAGGGGGATELITRIVISDGDASVIFTGFDDSTYESYEIYFANVVSQTDNRNFTMATSSDGGSTYDESSSDYSITVLKESSASALTLTDYNDSTSGAIYLSASTGAVATEEVAQGVSGKMEIFGAGNDSKYTAMNYTTGYPGVNASSIDNSMFWQGVAHRSEAAVVNAIRFQFSTFESGTISFYGIKK